MITKHLYDTKSRIGRPTGPSESRTKRPWDPTYLRQKDEIALLYVAANSGLERYKIAMYLGISGSRLSIISCSDLGENFLNQASMLPVDVLAPLKITNEDLE